MPSALKKKASAFEVPTTPLPVSTRLHAYVPPLAQSDASKRNITAPASLVGPLLTPYVGGNNGRIPTKVVDTTAEMRALNPLQCCLGTTCTVLSPAPGGASKYVLRYTDHSVAWNYVCVDGNFTQTGLTDADWYPVDSARAQLRDYAEYTPAYNATGPTGFPFPASTRLAATVGGVEKLWRYVGPADSPAPAPTGTSADAGIWVEISPNEVLNSVLPFYRAISVAVAQQLATDGDAIQPISYRILRGSDGTTRRGDVVVQGIVTSPATEAGEGDIPARFATVGLWLDPASEQWVQALYDVTTDAVVPLDFALLSPLVVTSGSQSAKGYPDATALLADPGLTLTDATLVLNTSLLLVSGQALFDLAAVNGNGNRIDGGGRLEVAKIYNATLVNADVSANLFQCEVGAITYSGGGRAADCTFSAGLIVTGTLRLAAGTVVPSNFFTGFTHNSNGSYTTPDGGTVWDERSGAPTAAQILAQIDTAASSANGVDVAISSTTGKLVFTAHL